MNRNMFRLSAGAVALALALVFGLVFGAFAATPKSGKAAPGGASTVTVEEKVARVSSFRVTQAEREAAAARIKLQMKIAALTSSKSGTLKGQKGSVSASAMTTATQGGVPDYFGLTPNWAYSPLLRKFVDELPGLGEANANLLGQYLSVGKPDTITYPGSDYYEISIRDYEEQMHSDLPPTTLRGYVQTNMGTDEFGENTLAPDPIHYLGPTIIARKDRPVRIKFTNELATGTAGDLFIPVDTSVMGAGTGPTGEMYTQNRATLHLHGGITPWISDGTPHQWITPAGEDTPYPRGVSVKNVPDMPDPGDGSMTFFYSNQQSARLMFYHDHSFGITRLNVYAGEAAGYIIRDEAEDELIADGVIPSGDQEIPLIIQDKTFVDATTILDTDPTWNWGTGALSMNGIRTPKTGDLWVPHVYVPAQNPADIGGMNATGRWHYGPWFWPPVTNIDQGPVPNPYYDPENAPWENEFMPGTPQPSMGMEHYNDTPLVNGTAYPKLNVEPKPYRLRILNAANDRFFNLQMYVADPDTQSVDGRLNTEVKMVPAVATEGFPELWPDDGRLGGVPDPATMGPQWIQIGTESGFLPMPAFIDQQPITWNRDPTTFNMGNVEDHSLLLGTAERADVIVDFSKYAGKTLILYNDAPTAFPALDQRTDYFTGAPDMRDTGGTDTPQVGFGPNTRTIMQINVGTDGIVSFDTTKLVDAFKSTDTTEGVFESSQNPIHIPDARYNETYNQTFTPDPYVRIYQNSMKFKTLAGNVVSMPLEPKAIQDEQGEVFDPRFGRMSGKLGLEMPGTNSRNQNFIVYSFIDPTTENLTDQMTPMAPIQADGTQIWKITHNGVDTHPIHFHLFDVQLINRVGWDGAIRPPDDNELGWKDTVRVSPLEDTIVALKPVAPKIPFGVPDSVRPLNPAEPIGSTMDFSNLNPVDGQPLVPPVTNQMTNFGWEYVWHCHILSHEEMDMMRPIVLSVARELASKPALSGAGTTGSDITLTWTDDTPMAVPTTWGNPKNEIGFRVERAIVALNGVTQPFETVGTALANSTGFVDPDTLAGRTYRYRVVAFNAAGETVSSILSVGPDGFTNRYEQDDAKLSMNGAWFTANEGSLSSGSYAYTSSGVIDVAFNGTGINWVTAKMNVNGIARVSLDGGAWQDVDLYAPTYLPNMSVYSVSGLTDGPHTLRIEPKGTKNPLSSGYWIGVDAFDVAGVLTQAARRYEQTNTNLYFSGSWNDASEASLSGGSYSYTAAGTADVAFNGTGISWVTAKMEVNGIARVSVDGGAWQNVDLYAPSYQPNSTVFSVSGLTDGPHTLRIEPTGTKNPASGDYWIGVDAFDVAGVLTDAGPARYEQNNADLAYEGVWNLASEASLSGGSYTYTNSGAVVAFFNGTGIDWITAKMEVNGIARVSVDGGAWQNVDLYAASYTPNTRVFSVSGLTDGAHTLRIEPTGTKNPASGDLWVGVDAFDVSGVLVPQP